MSVTSFTVKTRQKYKLILLGDQAVGKTCLIQQFVNGRFDDSQAPTVGIDFVVTNIHHRSRQYRLQLWDTAGQQRFKSLIPSYLRDSQCALILYDVSNKQSYDNVVNWLKIYQDNVEENSLVVVIGNKIDLKFRYFFISQNQCIDFQVVSKRMINLSKWALNIFKFRRKLAKMCINCSMRQYNQQTRDKINLYQMIKYQRLLTQQLIKMVMIQSKKCHRRSSQLQIRIKMLWNRIKFKMGKGMETEIMRGLLKNVADLFLLNISTLYFTNHLLQLYLKNPSIFGFFGFTIIIVIKYVKS